MKNKIAHSKAYFQEKNRVGEFLKWSIQYGTDILSSHCDYKWVILSENIPNSQLRKWLEDNRK